MPTKPSIAEKLCLTCGLCCNGVIFANVQLQPDDDASKLETMGLALRPTSRTRSAGLGFLQPCVAFDGCRCRVYADRPNYCRAFDCALLKSVNSGEMKTEPALRIIEQARRRAEKVRQLLRQTGDKDEKIALSLRFRRTIKRIEKGSIDPQTGAIFSELTLAVQKLNVLLSEKFYPGN